MPPPERDGGKDSRHGGKERVIQAAKPLGTVVEVLQSTSVLLTSYSNFGDAKYMTAIV